LDGDRAGRASSPAASAASFSPQRLAVLHEPGAAVPTGVAFETDHILVTLDASHAYEWDIAAGSPTPTDHFGAAALASSGVTSAGAESMSAGSTDNVVRVGNTATGKLVATLAAPSGTSVEAYALSPDGTEAAVADSNGLIYVWKIAS
jgi:WD40 repeat protein